MTLLIISSAAAVHALRRELDHLAAHGRAQFVDQGLCLGELEGEAMTRASTRFHDRLPSNSGLMAQAAPSRRPKPDLARVNGVVSETTIVCAEPRAVMDQHMPQLLQMLRRVPATPPIPPCLRLPCARRFGGNSSDHARALKACLNLAHRSRTLFVCFVDMNRREVIDLAFKRISLPRSRPE